MMLWYVQCCVVYGAHFWNSWNFEMFCGNILWKYCGWVLAGKINSLLLENYCRTLLSSVTECQVMHSQRHVVNTGLLIYRRKKYQISRNFKVYFAGILQKNLVILQKISMVNFCNLFSSFFCYFDECIYSRT